MHRSTRICPITVLQDWMHTRYLYSELHTRYNVLEYWSMEVDDNIICHMLYAYVILPVPGSMILGDQENEIFSYL